MITGSGAVGPGLIFQAKIRVKPMFFGYTFTHESGMIRKWQFLRKLKGIKAEI